MFTIYSRDHVYISSIYSVLIGEDNSLKISDFGTCRSLGTHTTRITVIGSCSWMAPELIRNEPCNEKVDVWSFGVLLWELLTRQEPYKVHAYTQGCPYNNHNLL